MHRLHRQNRRVPQTVELDPFADLLRAVVNISRWHPAQKSWMYAAKARFDERVSKESLHFSGVQVGMPSGCAKTFSSNRVSYKVLHQVDAHPDTHNSILLSHFKRRDCQEELIPLKVRDRIVAEADLADIILVPSSVVSRQFVSSGIDKARLLMKPYGVDLDRFVPSFEILPANRRPRLLFVGQISYRKGLTFLLAASRGLDIELDLIGPVVSPSILKSLPQNAHYLGPRGQPDVIKAMQAADCFVLPSIEDACALVIAEAVACGLPVITTEANGACELVDACDATVVKSGNIIALKHALQAVVPLAADTRLHRHQRSRNTKLSRIVDWKTYANGVIDSLLLRSKRDF